MALLILLALLQDPETLPDFLAALEKDRAKGATPVELLKKLDAWSKEKPPEILERLAWNRALLETTIRVDLLFVDGLKPRVGKEITLGRYTGTLREVKKDRLIMAVGGGQIEMEFAKITPDVFIDDLKRVKLLAAKSLEEAIYRFAMKPSPGAMAVAHALPDVAEKGRALAAVAGWVLQEADRNLAAGGAMKAAEPLSSLWAKEPGLVEAAGGAIRKFIDRDLSPKLIAAADANLQKDRATARRILEMTAGLCRSAILSKQVTEKLWTVMESGEWMKVPLEALVRVGGSLEGSKVVWEDLAKGSSAAAMIDCAFLPVAWAHVSGLRAKIRPGNARYVDLRLGWGDPMKFHAAAYQHNGPGVFYVYYPGLESPGKSSSAKEIARKAEYEFRAEAEGRKWKFSVDAVTLQEADADGPPGKLQLITDEGKSELTSLEVRKQ